MLLEALTTHSRNDHGCVAPGCWHEAMHAVANCEYREDEARALVTACNALADQATTPGDTLPGWAQILPLIFIAFDTHNSGKQKAVPFLSALLERMGNAANLAS